jgi:hypothetical protein
MIPRYWPLGTLFRLLALYLVLVAYSACYEYFYAQQLTTLFHDEYTAFDFGKLSIYKLICFLTPLAIVPMGTRLRSAGQLIAGAAAVFIFIPIPIVFLAMVPRAEFWGIYALLWVTYFLVCSMSSLSVRLRVPEISEHGFQRFMVIFYVLAGLGFLYSVSTNHFQISSLDKAHAAQADVTVKGLQAYLLIGFMGSFGGLLIALAVVLRKYYLLPLALLGYFLCYGSLSERVAVLMPMWVAYIGLAGRWFFRDSMLRYVFTVMAPFVFFFSLGLILGLEDRTSTFYDAFTLANYRLYAVPAISFPVYYNYFATHPYTYWSHIGFIGNFVHYPYGQPLALVMADAYAFGNDNASFIETDGLAAAGPVAMPFAAAVFGLVLIGINSCTRGLNRVFLAIVMAGASVTLIDTGLGPGLVTNGLALLSVLLLFAPRDAAWNLRYLHTRLAKSPAAS